MSLAGRPLFDRTPPERRYEPVASPYTSHPDAHRQIQ